LCATLVGAGEKGSAKLEKFSSFAAGSNRSFSVGITAHLGRGGGTDRVRNLDECQGEGSQENKRNNGIRIKKRKEKKRLRSYLLWENLKRMKG